TVSTGIGGGIILDGRPFRGGRGFAGEVGHVPIFAAGGAACTCGKEGCLEAYCSGLSIARRAKEALKGRPAALDGNGAGAAAPQPAGDHRVSTAPPLTARDV